jgi:branched-chain amino acid transport system substrate-binding protein
MKKSFVIVGFLALVIAVTVIPGSVFAERGVTDTEIKIGQWGPQTGPAALWGAVARGSGCYFDMLNAEGGIAGRKIKYYMRDDGYQPPRTKAIVKELVENEGVFAFVGGVGTSPGLAVKPFLLENKVPWVAPSSGSTHWGYPPTRYIFGVYPLYCDEAAILVRYAVNKLGKKRIGFFYQNDDYGKLGLYGAQLEAEKLGVKMVTEVPVEVMDTDLSSHCLKLKEAKPDVVIMWVLPKHGAIMLGTAAKLGFKPQWMTSSTLSDIPLMYKITKGLWAGMIFTNFGELPDSPSPLMQKYREAHAKYAPKDRWGTFFTAGILFAEPMVEAFRRCGRDLTLDRFISAMESLKNFQGIGPKITFGPDIRQGAREVFLAQCLKGGKVERLSDWIRSDIDLQKILKMMGQE